MDVYKWLGKNKDNELNDDTFLKAFWLLYFSNKNMVSKDFKAYQKNIFTEIFHLEETNQNIFLERNELYHWLNEMSKSVKLWFFINNPYFFDDKDEKFEYLYNRRIQVLLDKILSFPLGYGRYMLNLILAILIKYLPEVENNLPEDQIKDNLLSIENLLKAIERHNVVCFLLQGNKTNFRQEDTFRDINYFYRYGKSFTGLELLKVLSENRVEHFNWDSFRANIHKKTNRFFGWKGVNYIMREWECTLSNSEKIENYSLNYIYPESDNEYIRKSYIQINSQIKNNRDKTTYSLGNLYLSRTVRTSYDFDTLKKRISNSLIKNEIIFNTEKEILDYEEWNIDSVKTRGTKILYFMINHWNLPSLKQQTQIDDILIN
ncbi:hypothetical protein LEQ04_07495 [Riemerella anatipestifer]|nr:hypothetical protein LEQ05_11890 [Riemerella anatipestifer]WPC13775.1 hypothetical protein LEQ03_03795 [Riemerella anatipestifer]WPC14471.1 hypothetical protein LEQ04_07495 [Riemerella anatipestifer]